MTTETVQVRHLIPAEGKAIKNTVTGEYFHKGLYLAKGERASNYIEVDISEMSVTEEMPTVENSEEV